MDSNSLVFQQQTTSLSLSVSKCTTPALKLTRRLKSKKLFTDWWVWSLFDQLNLDLFNVCRLCIKSVGGGFQQITHRKEKGLWHTANSSFSTPKVHTQDILGRATWIRNVWNSPLRCSPITAIDVYPWIGPDSHSMPSWSRSHTATAACSSTPNRGRDSATQLQGNCHSHGPLAPSSPVDEEKCIHHWDAIDI